jgi:DNA polymerase III gamma/tau subunit
MILAAHLYPAHLWIGQQEDLVMQAESLLQEFFCSDLGCKACRVCKQIAERQHHQIRWIIPENSYTINHLDTIFSTIKYKLDPGERFFFILDRIDMLNAASANSLLKILEEPPTGYHFILLSPWLEGILPTVISRCIVQSFSATSDSLEHSLLPFFTELKNPDFVQFAKELDRLKITERDTATLIDQIQSYWLSVLKKSLLAENHKLTTQAQKILELINTLREYPPMPGSAKYFLKNLFLQISMSKLST